MAFWTLGALAAVGDGGSPSAQNAKAGTPGPPGSVTIVPNRTTAVVGTLVTGAPVERAVAGRAYGLAVAQDREEQWTEAATLYQQAVVEWSAEQRVHPSPALETAIQKAERERQRSQMLANIEQPRPRQPVTVNRALTLERARLFRTKLMVVRAHDGAVPEQLYAHARDALEEAARASEGQAATAQSEVRLLLCATHAAGGAPAAARLALAHVTRDQRQEPANALPMALCFAALGESRVALAHLEAHLRQRVEPFSQRDLFLANDWDQLRGQRRFENLFALAPRY